MVMALTARRQVSSHSRTFHACADERVKARLGSLLRDRPEEGMDGASASKAELMPRSNRRLDRGSGACMGVEESG